MSFPGLSPREASVEQWQRKAASVINAHSRALQAAGPTAERPAQALGIGQTYFDTTLGMPVWWHGAAWVDGTGRLV